MRVEARKYQHLDKGLSFLRHSTSHLSRKSLQGSTSLTNRLAPVALIAIACGGCGLLSKPVVDNGHWAARYDDAVSVPGYPAPLSATAQSPPRLKEKIPLRSSNGSDDGKVPRDNAQKAKFYWHYAALAASIYGTEGIEDTSLLLAVSSPYLRKEVSKASVRDKRIDEEYKRVVAMSDVETYQWLGLRCVGANTADPLCKVYHRNRHALRQLLPDNAVKMKDEVPRSKVSLDALRDAEGVISNKVEDCDLPNPKVPLTIAMEEMNWERVKEIDKYTVGRDWRVFVPDLAIDVWRRNRPEFLGDNAIEYAIVYRGTVGSGGWMSNFRILTGIIPFVFWDQYLQAEAATSKIVEQIYMLHSVRDSLMPEEPRSKIMITAVGHSLGAGLASYVHYRIPAITRVVGFNPTPIDGSRSLVGLMQRDAFVSEREGIEPLDVDPPLISRNDGFEHTSVYLLYEKGEVLSRIDTCDSGPVWGNEGGPTVLCERVNLSSGSIFNQHSMPQLACKLALEAGINASRGLPGDLPKSAGKWAHPPLFGDEPRR